MYGPRTRTISRLRITYRCSEVVVHSSVAVGVVVVATTTAPSLLLVVVVMTCMANRFRKCNIHGGDNNHNMVGLLLSNNHWSKASFVGAKTVKVQFSWLVLHHHRSSSSLTNPAVSSASANRVRLGWVEIKSWRDAEDGVLLLLSKMASQQ